MIASSQVVKLVALSAAIAAHAGLVVVLGVPSDPRIEGRAQGGELRLGSAFEDLSAGHVTPAAAPAAPAERAEADVQAALAPTIPAGAAPSSPVAARVAAVTPDAARAESSVARTPAAPDSAAPAVPSTTETMSRSMAEGTRSTRVPEGTTGAAAAAGKTTAQAAATVAVPPATVPPNAAPAQAQQATPADTARPAAITGQPVAVNAPDRSLRPRARAAPTSAPVRADVSTPARATGNAPQTARAGAATGTAQGTARSSGAGAAAQAGNAAATDYPGKVMARLSRVRRPDVGVRGTAAVAFTVASGGALADVTVARSSGSETLDRAAVQLVRRAAPFPPPPPGAQRRFAISISGR